MAPICIKNHKPLDKALCTKDKVKFNFLFRIFPPPPPPPHIQEVIARCQDFKFEANSVDSEGNTQFHLLVKRKFETGKEKLKEELMVALLTYSHAKVNYPNNDGNTPLHSAVQVS